MTSVFQPILTWAIGGALLGAGLSAATTYLYAWFTHFSITTDLWQNNTCIGALVGVHLSLLVAYLRSYKDDTPDTWEVTQRDPGGIILAVLVLIYAICWIAISL